MGRAVLAGIAAVVMLGALIAAIYAVRYVSADARGSVSAQEQVKSGTFRIAAYDHFFDLCSAVQSDEARIRALRDERENASVERVEQINASLTAITASRASKVARYNADAAKDYTIGQFRSSRLPYSLDVNREETECAI